MPETLSQDKARLRRVAAECRRAAAGGLPPEAAGQRLRDAFLAVGNGPDLPAGAAVSGFWPIGDEIDPRPLMAALADRGHPLALPVVIEPGSLLVFRAWAPGDPLEGGVYGTRHPAADRPEVVPRVALVPLLAFDASGDRLGYGGGYYDRTIAALRRDGPVVAIGVAYAAQEVDAVPAGPDDQRLDWIVTENRLVSAA